MSSLLRRGIKIGHLRLVAALAETGQVGAAAAAVGITQPAASRLLSEVEALAGAPLYARTGRGVALTPAGAALAVRAARTLLEIEDAGRELAEIAGGAAGPVRLGAVTGPAMDRILPALPRIAAALPAVRLEVVVATSDVLGVQLLAGGIDFALARLPVGAGADRLRFRPLATEPVSLVVRRGHPLAGRSAGGLPGGVAALFAHDWVMPGPEAILTRTVLDRLAALGLPAPRQRLATSSFLLTLAHLRESDAIAPLAHAVAARFAGGEGAELAVLPADLGIEVAAYGLVTRAGAALTPAAQRVCGLVLGRANEV
jgi:DNA-binding transcriptional LysR family regulator